MKTLANPNQRLRLGFVGGGLESSIGATHRYAAHLDGHFELVAGVFARDPQRNLAAAQAYGVDPQRTYTDFAQMAQAEAERADGIQAVAIMAPNAVHVPASLAFLEQGIDVICDKPLATSLDEARALVERVRQGPALQLLTHNYSGYPMIREARELIARGAIGEVRLVQVEHASAFGTHPLEQQGVKSLAWRTDPTQAGTSSVLADVGVHAHQLLRFVTGQEISEVSAELSTLVPGRRSDDNAHVKLRLSGGARGMLWASFVAAGHRHGLQIRVFGSTGSLYWHQEDPERLELRHQDQPHQVLRRGEAWLSDAAKQATRIKAGQPEGLLEAFANIYSDAAELIRARRQQRPSAPLANLCPTAQDGLRGMAFIDACVRSDQDQGCWTPLA
ncbi:Gfo/Idh/MocA family oxidoreductase [Pseudomonas sp. GD03860]|uniref:Gfo/Idh/MocA family protein n=1 Tax=Pseudomonas TaxID=286 RepID=UPI0023634CAF|nr:MULTISPECIES: Gfo/Idh/MocA family oxidoreductase [Pseudomonas]MDD2058870.1 Gfo/Idh/MocA family oxidoreductase [Pseudomonas putida]MDH0639916.1 Gfo/Idh/MocA family oxidoreductase [Pseudomonas sp. GD03860]